MSFALRTHVWKSIVLNRRKRTTRIAHYQTTVHQEHVDIHRTITPMHHWFVAHLEAVFIFIRLHLLGTVAGLQMSIETSALTISPRVPDAVITACARAEIVQTMFARTLIL